MSHSAHHPGSRHPHPRSAPRPAWAETWQQNVQQAVAMTVQGAWQGVRTGVRVGQPVVRIGDADREFALQALTEHFVAGRLDQEEFEERSGRVWQARTAADLTPLFADLPLLAPRPVPRRTSPARQRWRIRMRLLPLLAVLMVFAAFGDLPWVIVALASTLWLVGPPAWAPRRR